MKVGHEFTSVTMIPSSWYDETEKILYYDCPGFCDTNPVNEIIHSYSLQRLFAWGKKMKILLFFSEPSFTAGRALPINEAVWIIRDMVPAGYVERFQQALSIVFTKQPSSITEEQVREKIRRFPLFPGGNNDDLPLIFMPAPTRGLTKSHIKIRLLEI